MKKLIKVNKFNYCLYESDLNCDVLLQYSTKIYNAHNVCSCQNRLFLLMN